MLPWCRAPSGENLVSRHETLDVCVDRVLERIEGKNGGLFFGGKHYKSVLFPILGTGHGGFFNSEVVPRLVQRALHFFRDNPRAKLSEIYFCAYTQSDREILERELAKLASAGEIERIDASGKRPRERRDRLTRVGRRQIASQQI